MAGGMHGRGVHGGGAWVAGDMHGRGHVWGVCVTGQTATAADGTYPTGILSCFIIVFVICMVSCKISHKNSGHIDFMFLYPSPTQPLDPVQKTDTNSLVIKCS